MISELGDVSSAKLTLRRSVFTLELETIRFRLMFLTGLIPTFRLSAGTTTWISQGNMKPLNLLPNKT